MNNAPAEAHDKRNVSPNFLTAIIDEDLRGHRYAGVLTRFPPEPNGYLHIGHAKSICLNFGLALDYGSGCNLRFDDTNPETESMDFVEAIRHDVQWLGFRWRAERFASDYFDRLYEMAVQLIIDGKAYVDSVTDEEMSAHRGTITTPGTPTPYRDRSVAENLDLFARMRKGEYPGGAHVLRAKIDLASRNMKMRDPVLYRIVHATHYRTGDAWPLYPLYDFAHPLSDAIEGITHSICTLEFENNRAVYDWLIENLRGKCGLPASPRPYQHEFARLNLDYTVLSKRKLIRLVEGGFVAGWDDPRMPTISGLRRRGVTPEAIREFANRIGVAKANSRVDLGLFEAAVRDDLNTRSPRVLAVLRPLRVEITNYPEGRTESLTASYWPHDVPKEGSRALPFSRDLYIERDDFRVDPPKGFHRLTPGGRVRLRHAYVIRCDEVLTDDTGEVVGLRCAYDPDTLGKQPAGGAVKGTIHWVSAAHAVPTEVRLVDRLFTVTDPDSGDGEFTALLNPDSLTTTAAFVEPSVLADPSDARYQFERLGYFWRDPVDSREGRLVFNRIVTLRDSWTKAQAPDAPAVPPAAALPRASGTPPARRSRKAEERPVNDGKRSAESRPRPDADFSPSELAVLSRLTARGIKPDAARALARDPRLFAYFSEAARDGDEVTIANWVVKEIGAAIRIGDVALAAGRFAAIVALVTSDKITSRTAKEVLAEAMETGIDPVGIVQVKGLFQISDPRSLDPILDRIVAANADQVAQFRAGKKSVVGYLVGQVMKETDGRANPAVLNELLAKKLGAN